MPATPDVEEDVLQLLAAQASLSALVIITGANRNAWAGKERPSQGTVPMAALFVEHAGVIYDHDNDANNRRFRLQLVIRGGRNGDTAAKAKATAIHDAIADHERGSFGRWTGPSSGVAYIDLECTGVDSIGPGESDAVYWIVSAEAWYGG